MALICLESRELKIGITLECDICSTLRIVEACVSRLKSRSRRALCVPHYHGTWILLRDFIWFPKIRLLFERYKNETIKLKWLRKWGVCLKQKLKKFLVLQASIPPIQFWFTKLLVNIPPSWKFSHLIKKCYFEDFTRNWLRFVWCFRAWFKASLNFPLASKNLCPNDKKWAHFMKIHDLFIIYLRRTSQPYPRKTERPKVPRFMQKNGHCNIRQAAQVNF